MTTEITAVNAYRYCDNFAIESESSGNCYGCEHNQQEAELIAAYLTNYHGKKVIVRRNGKDQVRAAKQFRSEPYLVSHRNMILAEMLELKGAR